ncbi:MAG: competence protein ComK [Bacilli bacterium]|nr:competence protein ComK [Bacilli bacterium]
MKNDYVINAETVVVMSVGSSCCKVYELDDCFEVNMSLKEIIELSCNYFGSSFNGRLEGSKYYLGYNYKLPIIVDEYRDIIVFPTKSYESNNNYLISLNQIKDFEKKNKGILIYLKNGKNIEIEDSYGIFENQYLKAQKLLLRLIRIKNTSL